MKLLKQNYWHFSVVIYTTRTITMKRRAVAEIFAFLHLHNGRFSELFSTRFIVYPNNGNFSSPKKPFLSNK